MDRVPWNQRGACDVVWGMLSEHLNFSLRMNMEDLLTREAAQSIELCLGEAIV